MCQCLKLSVKKIQYSLFECFTDCMKILTAMYKTLDKIALSAELLITFLTINSQGHRTNTLPMLF